MRLPGLLALTIGCLPFWLDAADSVSSLPQKSGLPEMGLARGMLALLAVLLVILLLARFMRHFVRIPSLPADSFRILGGIPLTAREKVMLLQVGKKQLVLGVSPGRIETLCQLEGEDCLPVLQHQSIISSENMFAEQLRQFLAGKKDT